MDPWTNILDQLAGDRLLAGFWALGVLTVVVAVLRARREPPEDRAWWKNDWTGRD